MSVVMYDYAWGKDTLASTCLSVMFGVGAHMSSADRRRNINCIWSSNLPHPGFFASDFLVVCVCIFFVVAPSLYMLVVVCCRYCTIIGSNRGVDLSLDVEGAVYDAPWIGCAATIFSTLRFSHILTPLHHLLLIHMLFLDFCEIIFQQMGP